MTVFRVLALSLAFALLAACDEPPKSPAPVPAVPKTAPEPTSLPEPEPPAESVEPGDVVAERVEPNPAPASKTVEPPRPAKPAVTASATPKAPAPPAKLPPVKLDLRLPTELVQRLEPGEPLERLPEQPLLPPLFVEKPAEPGPYQLNGRLITNERVDGYWESVEGAELQIEFRN